MKELLCDCAVFVAALALLTFALVTCGCDDLQSTTEAQQAAAQAQSLEQAHAQVGMPAITHFEEKRMVKDLYEMRDQAVGTQAYLVLEMRGCLLYLGPAVGYGLPYATQYTSPTRVTGDSASYRLQVPQPEPNGLYMPASADGTWVMLKDPESAVVKPVYVEPRVILAPFRLSALECAASPAPAPSAASSPAGKR